jgi:uncharacterized protein with HEPN domain
MMFPMPLMKSIHSLPTARKTWKSSGPISDARKIVDTRNRIIHAYDNVSDEIMWSIIIKHLPILKTEIRKLLTPSA